MTEGPAVTAAIDLSIYTMDAVLKSAYRFSGRWHIELQKLSETSVQVSVRSKRAGEDAVQALRDFQNDLIDQRLRTTIATETASVRDLIMAHALSSTTLVRDQAQADAEPTRGNI